MESQASALQAVYGAIEDEKAAADPEGEGPGEFADDGHDEAAALASVYGPDDAGEFVDAAE